MTPQLLQNLIQRRGKVKKYRKPPVIPEGPRKYQDVLIAIQKRFPRKNVMIIQAGESLAEGSTNQV